MIVQKTPLFDRAIPGRSDTNSSPLIVINQINTTGSLSSSDIDKTTVPNLLTYRDIPETITDQPISSRQSCTTPWNSIVSDNNSIIAYRIPKSNHANECISEIRTCQDGSLWWTFNYETCNYIIDGQITDTNGNTRDVISWASNSDQRLINLSKFYKKIESTPREYIQPKPYQTIWNPDINKVKWLKMENNNKPTIQKNTADTLDQSIRQVYDDKKAACNTPWGKAVDHWSFIYAYNNTINIIWQQCVPQKRSCNDGILWWSYQYESCKFNIDNNNPQATIYAQPATIYRGIASPYSPYVRSIGDIVHDDLLLSHSNSKPSKGQNFIKISNCLTPWGSTILDGERITAYRLPTSTSNSLCDSETRVCRTWTLWWRYTYPSCIPNLISMHSDETWVERNIKSIGKDADNVRWWIKWWFR